MKQILLLIVCAFLLTSCNFTEEITFNNDGSGEFVMSYDMGEVMKVLEEMSGEKKEKEDKDKVKIDSVVYFKDMLVEKADSIAQLPKEEQEQLKALESIVMKMKMDEDTGQFDFGFGSTFTSLENLPEALEKIEQVKKMNSKDNPQFSKMDESAVSKSAESMFEYIDFAYDGNTFSRSLKKDYEKSPENIESLETEISQMGDSKEMFEKMSYTLVYNFPKKIKSVSNKNAQISEDGKTVTLKINFIEMIKDPEITTLDVKLEE